LSETQLVSAILDALRLEPGVMAMRNAQLTARRSGRAVRAGLGKGSADIIACVDGLFVALEVKLPRGNWDEDQERWARRLWRAKGEYYLVTSVQQARQAIAAARIPMPGRKAPDQTRAVPMRRGR